MCVCDYIVILKLNALQREIVVTIYYISGCGFTKDARDLCAKCNIRGWVKNSKRGTIVGKMQGSKQEINKL